MRPHITVLVSAFHGSEATTSLRLLGATTTFLPAMSVVDTLRLGTSSRLVADVIVIDSTTGLGGPQRNVALIKDIRGLSDAKMLTGVRWNAIPIMLIVGDEATEGMVTADLHMTRFVALASGRGWPRIYDVLADQAVNFSLALVDQMRSLGWTLVYQRGRWIRIRPPKMQRRHGSTPETETEYYDMSADQWFRETGKRKERFKSVGFDQSITVEDLDRLELLIYNPNVREAALQNLIEEAPYLLEAARLELIAHPQFPHPQSGVLFPDLIRHRLWEPKIDIVELKMPQATLVARRGRLIYQSAEITAGLEQVRQYADVAIDPVHLSSIEAIFGEPVSVSSTTLVIGMSTGVDPDALDKIRSRIPDTQVRTWDSILSGARKRFEGGSTNPSGRTRTT